MFAGSTRRLHIHKGILVRISKIKDTVGKSLWRHRNGFKMLSLLSASVKSQLLKMKYCLAHEGKLRCG